MKRYKQDKLEEKIKKSDAYWISPNGKILPVAINHITDVFQNPNIFGMDIEEIERIYDEEGESYRSEGKAREKILKKLFLRGWIRLRFYDRQYFWSINVGRLMNKQKDRIQKWASAMMDLDYGKFTDVIIDTLKSNKKYEMGDLASDILYMESNENIPRNRATLKFEEDFKKV